MKTSCWKKHHNNIQQGMGQEECLSKGLQNLKSSNQLDKYNHRMMNLKHSNNPLMLYRGKYWSSLFVYMKNQKEVLDRRI